MIRLLNVGDKAERRLTVKVKIYKGANWVAEFKFSQRTVMRLKTAAEVLNNYEGIIERAF